MNGLDWLVVAAGIAALMAVALVSARRSADTREFFLARRGLPAWAVCLSFVATEISAVTIVGVPADAYRSDWGYLQMFIGSAAARIAIAFLFIPAFYRTDCTTIYEYLRDRFGPATQYAASGLFLVTRLLASAVRLYAAALGTAVIIGWIGGGTTGEQNGLIQTAVAIADRPVLLITIGSFALLGIGFVSVGGMRAIVWTNVLQAMVFLVGGGMAAWYLASQCDGGFSGAMQVAAESGKLRVFNPTLSASDAKALHAMIFSGFFTSLAVFGTDQDLMQRLLSVETRRNSQRSLLATIAVGLPTAALFLLIGTLLYVFYQQHPGLPGPTESDRVLPHFVQLHMPHAMKGLLLLTVLMASIDSPLGALAASFVTDLYRPLIRPDADERHYMRISRLSVAGFGLILAALAFAASYLSGVLWVAFQVISVTGGSLLGVFLLGLLTRRRSDHGNVIAMFLSAACMAVLMYLIQTERVNMGWTWLIVIGTILTAIIAYVLGQAPDNHEAPAATSPD